MLVRAKRRQFNHQERRATQTTSLAGEGQNPGMHGVYGILLGGEKGRVVTYSALRPHHRGPRRVSHIPTGNACQVQLAASFVHGTWESVRLKRLLRKAHAGHTYKRSSFVSPANSPSGASCRLLASRDLVKIHNPEPAMATGLVSHHAVMHVWPSFASMVHTFVKQVLQNFLTYSDDAELHSYATIYEKGLSEVHA